MAGMTSTFDGAISIAVNMEYMQFNLSVCLVTVGRGQGNTERQHDISSFTYVTIGRDSEHYFIMYVLEQCI